MAYCPRCNGEMGLADAVCPHCGFEYPESPAAISGRHAAIPDRREGFAYSSLADIALMVGGITAGIGGVVTGILSLAYLFHGDWLIGLVYGPLATFTQLALLVVFLRVQDLSP